MYERTPKGTMPKWIKISLIAIWTFFTAIFALMIIMLAIEDLAFGFFVFTIISLCYFGFIVKAYNWRRAYMEIESDTIYITDYPFFKERKKVVSVKNIHKIKWQSGGKGGFPHLIFKNQENKALFSTADLPEIRTYFTELGFEIT
jgi:membrane protein YdbS with pleckstrin-like domain